MQNLVYLLIAFIVGFFSKMLIGTMCNKRLVEGGFLDNLKKRF
jgi:hypothetical protein